MAQDEYLFKILLAAGRHMEMAAAKPYIKGRLDYNFQWNKLCGENDIYLKTVMWSICKILGEKKTKYINI